MSSREVARFAAVYARAAVRETRAIREVSLTLSLYLPFH